MTIDENPHRSHQELYITDDRFKSVVGSAPDDALFALSELYKDCKFPVWEHLIDDKGNKEGVYKISVSDSVRLEIYAESRETKMTYRLSPQKNLRFAQICMVESEDPFLMYSAYFDDDKNPLLEEVREEAMGFANLTAGRILISIANFYNMR